MAEKGKAISSSNSGGVLCDSFDQTGVINSGLTSDNVRQLLNVINLASTSEEQNAILFINAEKAFDRLEWHYLGSVLQQIGFSESLIFKM